jgi:dihydrofolate reductase
MGKLRFTITMSLDGYVAGLNQSIENPLGEGGEDLHTWVVGLKFFKEMHGGEGGETGPDDDILRENFANLGVTMMGRNMFGGHPGDWGDGSWKGWWGDNPPYHHPVFVLTHYPREPLVMAGGTTFHFVTDGIESMLRQAREAAGDKDILIAGGAKIFQQYFSAGLIEEIELHVVPLLLNGGERLFDNVEGFDKKLEVVRTVPGNGVTHIKYRVVR